VEESRKFSSCWGVGGVYRSLLNEGVYFLIWSAYRWRTGDDESGFSNYVETR